jgi:isopentenyl phosphate kinase
MYIIKFGGSVITDKTSKKAFEKVRTLRLVSEITDSEQRTIVVHGAGSFGHILAKRYRLHEGFKNEEQLMALTEVQRDVKELNFMVLNAFLEQGVNAISLAPSSFLTNEDGVINSMDPNVFKRYFDMGLTPITFGDVVLDRKLKFSICSGDQLVLELAKFFKPEKVIFVTDVDGVFSSDPKSDDKAELLTVLDEESYSSIKKSHSDVDDVTGSMFGKLEIMFDIAAIGLETIIINGTVENRLRDTLRGGEVPFTRVEKRH